MASREEKSLRQSNIVAQLLMISINCCPAHMEKNKQTNKQTNRDMYGSPVHGCTQEQTVSHTFLPSFDNANGRLCQERLLRSRNFAAMVT